MLTRCFTILLCLGGMATLCLADGFVPGRKYFIKNTYTPRSQKTISLDDLPFKVQAEKLTFMGVQEDRCFVILRGNAQLLCGQTLYKADEIEVSYQDQSDQQISMQGNVKILNARDQIMITAQAARLENANHFLTLQSRDAGPVTLRRTQNQQTTQIKAAHLMLKYKDLHTLLIKPVEQISIDERPEVITDRVEVSTVQPSEHDFFDGVAVTEVKIYGYYDQAVEARKP